MAGPRAIQAARQQIKYEGNWEQVGAYGDWKEIGEYGSLEDGNAFSGRITHSLKVGDTVRCRNKGQEWKTGTVTQVRGGLRARLSGWMFDAQFDEVEKAEQRVKKEKPQTMPSASGVVKNWFPGRGFGIIECTGGEYRGYGDVHCYQQTIGRDYDLKKGAKVTFNIWQNADTKKFECANVTGPGLVPKEKQFFDAGSVAVSSKPASKAQKAAAAAPARPKSAVDYLTLPKQTKKMAFDPNGGSGSSLWAQPEKKKRKKNTEAGAAAEC